MLRKFHLTGTESCVAGARRSALLCFATVLAGSAGAQPPAPAAATGPSPAERAAGATDERPYVPVHREPHHRQVFQYGSVRILDLQVPPGETSWFHTHEWPVLYMTIGRSAVRAQDLGGEWSGGPQPPNAAARTAAGAAPASAQPTAPSGGVAPASAPQGAAAPAPPRTPRATSTTSYAQKPITHRLENIGDGLFRAMVVVNETAGDETKSVQTAGFDMDGEPELTNGWFRSYRVTLAPGQKTAAHVHHEAVVVFQATPGKGIATGPMKFELNEPGQWAFFDADIEHEIANTGDGPLELLEIEVRRK